MTVTDVADATTGNLHTVPSTYKQLAGYTTGIGIQWTAAQWAAHPTAIRICQNPGATDLTADVLDVESGAATVADCPGWAKAALANWHVATRPGQRSPAIYMSQSNVTAVVNALTAAKVSGIGLFVADWTGSGVMRSRRSHPPAVRTPSSGCSGRTPVLMIKMFSWIRGSMPAARNPGQAGSRQACTLFFSPSGSVD